MSANAGIEAPSRMSRARVALVTALVAVAVAAGLATHAMLAASSAPVHAFLVQGQRAVAQQDHAHAILAFERARWLAPLAPSVRTALTSLGAADPEGWPVRAVRLLSSQEWSVLATSFAWLAALAAGLALVTAPATAWRRALGRGALGALAGFVLTLGAVVLLNASSPAIVMDAAAPLLVAPYETAASESSLPAGTMVLTDGSYDQYVQVRAPGGLSGWVPRRSLEAIAVPGPVPGAAGG